MIGPESTGKSFLCEQLAKHYNTEWCPEYAREFLLTHGTNYSFDDLLTIARGQLNLEDKFESIVNSKAGKSAHSRLTTHDSPGKASADKRLLFIDTDMYVMKVWCEVVFGKVHPWILEQIPKRKYDLYLLCDVDLPWTQDGLREYPDLETRTKLFQKYQGIMESQSTPWILINGNTEERLLKATTAVDELLKNES
jgi:NadR type nicotinamide-nucleotide adenylyltransferase